MNTRVATNAGSSGGVALEEHGFDETRKGEVMLRQSVRSGTSTSVSSAMILLGLIAGTLQTSGVQTLSIRDPAIGSSVIEEWKLLAKRQPRTALGQRLVQLREQIIRSGTPLLSWDEIEREVADRRGEAV